jgi:hypothetical protein
MLKQMCRYITKNVYIDIYGYITYVQFPAYVQTHTHQPIRQQPTSQTHAEVTWQGTLVVFNLELGAAKPLRSATLELNGVLFRLLGCDVGETPLRKHGYKPWKSKSNGDLEGYIGD